VSALRGARIHYELFQVSDDILFSVEPAALNEFHRFTGIIQVSRCRFRYEISEIGKVLGASGQHLQCNQMCCGCHRNR